MGSYLYANPSFLSGVARLLDFGNTYDDYNRAPTGRQADSLGMLWDWAKVADDMWKGINVYELKYGSELHRSAPTDDVEFANR